MSRKIIWLMLNLFFFLLYFRGIVDFPIFEVVVVLIFFVVLLLNHKKIERKPNILIYLPIFIILCNAIIGFFFSEYQYDAISFLLYLIQGILCFYMIRHFSFNLNDQDVIDVVVFWSVLLSIISIILYVLYIYYGLFPDAVYDRNGAIRLVGFQTNPNYFSLTLSFVPLLIIVFDCRYKSLSLIPVLLAIFLSGSRGGLIASLVSMFAALLYKGYFKKVNVCFFTVTVILLLVSSYLSLFGSFVINDLDESNVLIRFFASDSDYTSGRLEHWRKAIELFSDNVLFGVGNNAFSNFQTENGSPIQVHNNYLRVLVESGIFGFMQWVFLFCTIIYKSSFRSYSIICLLPMVVFSLVNDPYIAKEFWIVLALALLKPKKYLYAG